MIVIVLYGERGTGSLLILSQVVLSLQLPFAVFPLVHVHLGPQEDGRLVAPLWMLALAWPVAVVIAALNAWLLYQTFASDSSRHDRADLCEAWNGMYTRILVAIEHSAADATILDHVRQLARLTHAELILVHVADGWAARALRRAGAARVRGDARRPRVPRGARRAAERRRAADAVAPGPRRARERDRPRSRAPRAST